MRILLAGGAGYIGSHTAVSLLDSGHEVVIVDNYCNSSPEAVKRIEEITGKRVISYDADVKDNVAINIIMQQNLNPKLELRKPPIIGPAKSHIEINKLLIAEAI